MVLAITLQGEPGCLGRQETALGNKLNEVRISPPQGELADEGIIGKAQGVSYFIAVAGP
jgi:hypothetical protein